MRGSQSLAQAWKLWLQSMLLVMSILAGDAWADVGDELGCITGDCENGHGSFVERGELGLLRYRGPFVNGKYHGFGELELIDKRVIYKGNFVNGQRSGRGTEWDRNTNNVYIGQWRNDKRNGQGLQAFHVDNWNERQHSEMWLSENTENYQGGFRNDYFDGEGTYRWPDGLKYIGGWAAHKKHGRGYFQYVSGNRQYHNYEFGERVYDAPLPR